MRWPSFPASSVLSFFSCFISLAFKYRSSYRLFSSALRWQFVDRTAAAFSGSAAVSPAAAVDSVSCFLFPSTESVIAFDFFKLGDDVSPTKLINRTAMEQSSVAYTLISDLGTLLDAGLMPDDRDATSLQEKQLKTDLEGGKDSVKIAAMKAVLAQMLRGESLNGILMHVIRFVMPSKNKQLKKLCVLYWEICPKVGWHLQWPRMGTWRKGAVTALQPTDLSAAGMKQHPGADGAWRHVEALALCCIALTVSDWPTALPVLKWCWCGRSAALLML